MVSSTRPSKGVIEREVYHKRKGKCNKYSASKTKSMQRAAFLIFEVLNERVIDFMFKTDSVLS